MSGQSKQTRQKLKAEIHLAWLLLFFQMTELSWVSITHVMICEGSGLSASG